MKSLLEQQNQQSDSSLALVCRSLAASIGLNYVLLRRARAELESASQRPADFLARVEGSGLSSEAGVASVGLRKVGRAPVARVGARGVGARPRQISSQRKQAPQRSCLGTSGRAARGKQATARARG